MIDYPRIVITAGEPAGIGPDLCLQMAQQQFPCELIVIADPNLLQQRANELGLEISLTEADLKQKPYPSAKGEVRYIPVSLSHTSQAGKLDKRNAEYVLNSLQIALDGCINNQFDAMVTAPVHKGIINDAGIEFTGHTEFLADGAGVNKVVMMLATEQLRVALATTHLPLKEVSKQITRSSLTKIISIIETSFQNQFGIKSPRIAVCGLNPHAGEGGHLGYEEIDVISPVIEQYKLQNSNISGPWPADTLFVDEKLKEYDVVLAMYHDQGLPVLKHHGFGQAVNVTLGLPFIRTSVDHGTALELAGTGQAKSTSLIAAITMALTMNNNRNAR
ncbi:MAG: 4-hydroxythreonine-4-phosphate dehydrogenase PdxA [Gammaproteobacteria bacterium]|nr:4-hydroxythreonine-4-phosphate dehydrogenase PdxA [Gammaproteobacteria bacterium]